VSDLVGALRGVLGEPPRLGAVRVIAIDGPSGSGKSVLADRLVGGLRAEGFGTGLVRTDHFATWDDPVSWWPRLVGGVLDPLAQGRVGRYRRVEWVDGVPRPGAYRAVASDWSGPWRAMGRRAGSRCGRGNGSSRGGSPLTNHGRRRHSPFPVEPAVSETSGKWAISRYFAWRSRCCSGTMCDLWPDRDRPVVKR
jgi:hypothetical protein